MASQTETIVIHVDTSKVKLSAAEVKKTFADATKSASDQFKKVTAGINSSNLALQKTIALLKEYKKAASGVGSQEAKAISKSLANIETLRKNSNKRILAEDAKFRTALNKQQESGYKGYAKHLDGEVKARKTAQATMLKDHGKALAMHKKYEKEKYEAALKGAKAQVKDMQKTYSDMTKSHGQALGMHKKYEANKIAAVESANRKIEAAHKASNARKLKIIKRTWDEAKKIVSGGMNVISATIKGGLAFALAQGFGLRGLMEKIFDAGTVSSKFLATFSVISETMYGARQEMEWLRETTQKLGVSFNDASVPYAKFAAAAKGMFTGTEVRDMFTNFSKASVALHLSAADVKGVFFALQQMVSKGTVSSEELKRQLAERIPGAMKIAADSMHTTVEQLMKDLAAGKVMASDFMVGFADEIGKRFGGAAEIAGEAAYAAFVKLKDQVAFIFMDIANGGAFEAMGDLFQTINDKLAGHGELWKGVGAYIGDVINSVTEYIRSMDGRSINTVVESFASISEYIWSIGKGIAQIGSFLTGIASSGLGKMFISDKLGDKKEDLQKQIIADEFKLANMKKRREIVAGQSGSNNGSGYSIASMPVSDELNKHQSTAFMGSWDLIAKTRDYFSENTYGSAQTLDTNKAIVDSENVDYYKLQSKIANDKKAVASITEQQSSTFDFGASSAGDIFEEIMSNAPKLDLSVDISELNNLTNAKSASRLTLDEERATMKTVAQSPIENQQSLILAKQHSVSTSDAKRKTANEDLYKANEAIATFNQYLVEQGTLTNMSIEDQKTFAKLKQEQVSKIDEATQMQSRFVKEEVALQDAQSGMNKLLEKNNIEYAKASAQQKINLDLVKEQQNIVKPWIDQTDLERQKSSIKNNKELTESLKLREAIALKITTSSGLSVAEEKVLGEAYTTVNGKIKDRLEYQKDVEKSIIAGVKARVKETNEIEQQTKIMQNQSKITKILRDNWDDVDKSITDLTKMEKQATTELKRYKAELLKLNKPLKDDYKTIIEYENQLAKWEEEVLGLQLKVNVAVNKEKDAREANNAQIDSSAKKLQGLIQGNEENLMRITQGAEAMELMGLTATDKIKYKIEQSKRDMLQLVDDMGLSFDSLNEQFSGVFVDMYENGKSFTESFSDIFKNMGKNILKTLMELAASNVFQGIIGSISNFAPSLAGVLQGVTGGQTGVQGVAGELMGGFKLEDMASGLVSLFDNGITGVFDKVKSGVSGMFNGSAAEQFAANNPSYASAVGIRSPQGLDFASSGLTSAISFGIGLLGDKLLGGMSSTFSSIGGMIGSAIPGIGTLIGSGIGAVVGSVFGGGKPPSERFWIETEQGRVQNDIKEFGKDNEGDSRYDYARSDFGDVSLHARRVDVSGMAQAIESIDGALYSLLSNETVNEAKTNLQAGGRFYSGRQAGNKASVQLQGLVERYTTILATADQEYADLFLKMVDDSNIGDIPIAIVAIGEDLKNAVGIFGNDIVDGANEFLSIESDITDVLSSIDIGTPVAEAISTNLATTNWYDQIGGGDANSFFGIETSSTDSNMFDQISRAVQTETVDQATEAYTGNVTALEKAIEKIREYSLEEETLTATYQRLVTEVVLYDSALDRMGQSFSGSMFELIDRADEFAKAAGGIENASSLWSSYFNTFYTDQERVTYQLEQAQSALNDFADAAGISLEGVNVSNFRKMFEAQRATMTAQSEVDWLAASQFMVQVEGLSNSLIELSGGQTLDSAKSDLIAAYEREFDIQRKLIETFENVRDSLRKFSDSLLLNKALSILTPAERLAEAKSQFESVASLAASGDITAMGELQKVSKAFLTESRSFNASNDQYTSDFKLVQQALTDSASSANIGITLAQRSLSILEKEFDLLAEANNWSETINESILSLADALKNFASAVGVIPAGVTGGGTFDNQGGINKPLSDSAFIEQLFTRGFGREASAGGVAGWVKRIESGVSRQSIVDSFASSNEASVAGFDTSNIRLFAKGGISNRPAIFGEAGAEAAVPLPDGRSIPVTLDTSAIDNSEVVNAIIASAESAAHSSAELKQELAESKKELVKLSRRLAQLEVA